MSKPAVLDLHNPLNMFHENREIASHNNINIILIKEALIALFCSSFMNGLELGLGQKGEMLTCLCT